MDGDALWLALADLLGLTLSLALADLLGLIEALGDTLSEADVLLEGDAL